MGDTKKRDFLRQSISYKAKELGELLDKLQGLQEDKEDTRETLDWAINIVKEYFANPREGNVPTLDVLVAEHKNAEKIYCSPSMLCINIKGEKVTVDRGKMLISDDKVEVEYLATTYELDADDSPQIKEYIHIVENTGEVPDLVFHTQ